MKKVALVIIVMSGSWAWASTNPDTYTTPIHVAASHLVVEGASRVLKLNTVIGGEKYELDCGYFYWSSSILALGDYKAKLVQDKHKTTYTVTQTYEFLFPDNRTQQCDVIGQTE